MNNNIKTTIYLSLGLSVPIILFFFSLFLSKSYTHYFDTHTRSEYGITNTYFQPSNLDDQTIREANKILNETCSKYESDYNKYEKCLKGILDEKVEQIYEIVQNITRNSNSINSELIQQGIYKNDEPNAHTYLVSYLQEMTESFFGYSEKLCLISLENHSEVKFAQVQNRKCVIYQINIYYNDLINLRHKWVTSYLINKFPEASIKTEEYQKAVSEEEYFQRKTSKLVE